MGCPCPRARRPAPPGTTCAAPNPNSRSARSSVGWCAPVSPSPSPPDTKRKWPRSGLAVKHGLTLPNSPATIDSDYRGELMIPMINLGREPVVVARGTRIAQLVFQRVEAVELVEVDELPGSERGEGGFGSTGV